MQTILLDAIKHAFVSQSPRGFNSGFVYAPMDIDPKQQPKIEKPETPEPVKRMFKARTSDPLSKLKGPQATPLTAQRDNVVNYRPKGIS